MDIVSNSKSIELDSTYFWQKIRSGGIFSIIIKGKHFLQDCEKLFLLLPKQFQLQKPFATIWILPGDFN